MLIVDLDPQGNASTGLGIDRRNRSCSTYDVLIGEAPAARSGGRDRGAAAAYRAPRRMDLSGLELELGTTPGRAFRLRDAIAALNSDAAPDTDYTYVLIDCPPSLNLLTVNAMAASDAILVPLQCEFFALEGLSQLLQTVEQVRVDAQSEPVDPRHRADHVRLAQQSLEPGRRRRPAVHGQPRSTTP